MTFNVRVQLTLTAWQEWEPFGLSPVTEPPQFGIHVTYDDPNGNPATLVLETKAITHEDFGKDAWSTLADAYQLATWLASTEMNKLPYQLPMF